MIKQNESRLDEGAGLVTFLIGVSCGLIGGVFLAILLGARFSA